MKILLKAEEITKEFNKKEQILKGISLDILEESFTVLLGPSGSGKSTLLNILSGLLKPTSGMVMAKDVKVSSLSQNQLANWKRNHTGNIFQNYLLLRNLTVEENIKIGIPKGSSPLPFDQLTELLDIHSLLQKFPAQLSGGEKQRTAIARAVIKKPEILFCDEATGALDEANSKKVVSLLHDLKKRFGVTILFVTHNKQIAHTANRVITIKDGLICGDKYNENPIPAEDMVWEQI